jgi:hypothetical protein
MAVTRQALTLAEFLQLPEEKPALEYVAGAVRQKVLPEILHSFLQKILCLWIDRRGRPVRGRAARLTARGYRERASGGAASAGPRSAKSASTRPFGGTR